MAAKRSREEEEEPPLVVDATLETDTAPSSAFVVAPHSSERARKLLNPRKVGTSDGWPSSAAAGSVYKQPFIQCCLAGPLRADEEYLYSMLASRAATERVIEWIARATPTTETSQIFSVLEGASSVFGTLHQRSEHTIKNVPSLALEEDESFSQFQRVLTNIAALPIRKLDAAKPSNSTKNERRPKDAFTSEKGFGSTTKGPSTTTTNKAPTASKSMITSARDRWMEHMEATAQAQGETVQSLRSDSSLNAYRLDVSEFASQAEEREYQTERAMAQRQQELANKRKQRREDASLQ